MGKTTQQNVILIGLMGTGKTTVGKKIASNLGFRFVDTDERIVEAAGKSIPEIFSDDGEDAFREIEAQTLRNTAKEENLVISTGGGVVLREANRSVLPRAGFCVWLQATVDTLFHRISGDSNRPLLQTDNPRDTIATMLAEREKLYSEVADLEVPTDTLIADDIAYGISESARLFFCEHYG